MTPQSLSARVVRLRVERDAWSLPEADRSGAALYRVSTASSSAASLSLHWHPKTRSPAPILLVLLISLVV
ncbi:hypothetical protein BaRGS_00039109 [Batillaria attramentaria]|uniref:Uncharacterized protein n=1 Tax=Batillaria attramentaria TaxID=370345 RepID=A0ABD0J501_9CAEN